MIAPVDGSGLTPACMSLVPSFMPEIFCYEMICCSESFKGTNSGIAANGGEKVSTRGVL
jgi:hypothetical protein